MARPMHAGHGTTQELPRPRGEPEAKQSWRLRAAARDQLPLEAPTGFLQLPLPQTPSKGVPHHKRRNTTGSCKEAWEPESEDHRLPCWAWEP